MVNQYHNWRGADVEVVDMNNVWYHGTTSNAAWEIIRTGKFKIQDEGGSAFDVSRPGKIYITRDIGVGIKHGETRVRDEEDNFLGILELRIKDQEKIFPDELVFGYQLIRGRRDYVLTEGKDRDDWELIEDEGIYFPYSGWDKIDDNIDFHRNIQNMIPNRIWNAIDDMKPDDTWDQEISASIGDDVIDHLRRNHPDLLRKMVKEEWFYNYTTDPSNVIITNGWEGTPGDFQRPIPYWDTPEEEDFDPQDAYKYMIIKMNGPIQARGIGRGWHNDRYRHALAARGIRTR